MTEETTEDFIVEIVVVSPFTRKRTEYHSKIFKLEVPGSGEGMITCGQTHRSSLSRPDYLRNNRPLCLLKYSSRGVRKLG